MNTLQQKSERIHALDALRAAMMLLGLVLHSALTYNVTVYGADWPFKDPNSTHILTDFLVFIIHSFRMPIFFMVAGFFGALLFYERQPIPMIKNRFSRIVFPFVVFLFLLWPIIIFSSGFTSAVFSNLENPLSIALATLTRITDFIPTTTSHLWFLYYLTLITGTTIILGLTLKQTPNLTNKITTTFDWIIQRPLIRIVLFTGLIFLILFSLKTSMVTTAVSLVPDWETFSYYFIFYLIGWILFKSKQHLNSFIKYDWASTIGAFILLTIKGHLIQTLGLRPNEDSAIMILLTSGVVCLFTFGITGLFIRYANKNSSIIRYLSDSSYWVYLIHLPIAVIIPAFISNLQIPVIAKFMIVLSVTTLICFVSYHFLVRSTFIGKFLNGKKYPTNLSRKFNQPVSRQVSPKIFRKASNHLKQNIMQRR